MEEILNQMFNGVQWQVSALPANTGGMGRIGPASLRTGTEKINKQNTHKT